MKALQRTSKFMRFLYFVPALLLTFNQCACFIMGDWDHLSLNSCPAISISGHSADIPFVEPVFDQLCPNPVTLYQDITKHRVQISVPGKYILLFSIWLNESVFWKRFVFHEG